MNNLIIRLVICIVLFLVNCASKENTNITTVVDGVTNVENLLPLSGDTPNIELKFVKKIGGLQDEDENYMLFNPKDVARDSDGNIYISDAGNKRIQKYDKDGKYLLTIGKSGIGPGEFQSLSYLEFNTVGNITTNALRKQRFIEFTPEGKFVKEYHIEGMPRQVEVNISHLGIITIGAPASKFRFLSNDNFIFNDSKNVSLMKIVDKDGSVVSEFGERIDFGNRQWNRIGNGFQFTIDNSDNIYLSHQFYNKIEKYSPDGKLMLQFSVPKIFDFATGFVTERTPIKSYNVQAGIPRDFNFTLPNGGMAYGDIEIDGKGRIWVESFRSLPDFSDVSSRGKYSKWDVFTKNGEWLTTLEFPITFDEMKIIDDTMFLIDPRTEMSVYEYEIVDK